MKCLAVLSFVIAVSTANVIKNPVTGYKDGDRFFYFPGPGNTLRLVDTLKPVDTKFIEQYIRIIDNNGYWLYTRTNPTTAQILRNGDTASVLRSNFQPSKVTVFLAHGWTGDGANYMNVLLTAAFLRNDDVNVIVVDWSELASQDYVTAKTGVPAVGRALGQFVNWLVQLGGSYENIHLVGHSLGGHLVGAAGRETGGRVQRITSLDPAGPLWLLDSNRIVPTDGVYVEVIHTDIALFGFTDPCGDTDFYPNGGASMPGCIGDSVWCSHEMAVDYMAASLIYNHLVANECGSLLSALFNLCSGVQLHMGNGDMTPKRPGIYRLNTGSEFPF